MLCPASQRVSISTAEICSTPPEPRFERAPETDDLSTRILMCSEICGVQYICGVRSEASGKYIFGPTRRSGRRRAPRGAGLHMRTRESQAVAALRAVHGRAEAKCAMARKLRESSGFEDSGWTQRRADGAPPPRAREKRPSRPRLSVRRWGRGVHGGASRPDRRSVELEWSRDGRPSLDESQCKCV